MFVSILESLVLRGVSVLCDGQTVKVLPLGTSVEAERQAPGIGNSMRHPSHGYRPVRKQPSLWRDHAAGDRMADNASDGAGRSLGRARALSRRSFARFAERAIRYGCAFANGGSTLANSSGRLPAAIYAGSRSTVRLAWSKPASRTPPASTRGNGVS
jgi:hypothetical protein